MKIDLNKANKDLDYQTIEVGKGGEISGRGSLTLRAKGERPPSERKIEKKVEVSKSPAKRESKRQSLAPTEPHSV